MQRRFLGTVCCLLGFVLAISAEGAQQPFGNRAKTNSISGNGLSGTPTVLPDGSGILFLSTASNLSTNEHRTRLRQLYFSDASSSAISLLTVASNGTAAMNGECERFFMSPNGAVVGIATFATDLAPGSNRKAQDLFLRRLGAGVPADWFLVSYPPLAAESRRREAFFSADGRFLFRRPIAGDARSISDTADTVYLLDPRTGFTSAISNGVTLAANGSNNLVSVNISRVLIGARTNELAGWLKVELIPSSAGGVVDAVSTPDGRYTAARLAATNAGSANNPLFWASYDPLGSSSGVASNLYLGDVSASGGDLAKQTKLLISQDGNRIFYIGGFRDIRWETNTPLPGLLPVCINSNGTVMVARDLTNAGFQHVVFNLETGVLQVIHNGAAPPVPLEFAMDFSMSADGNVIAFATTEDLTALGDRNEEMDVFRISPTNMTPVLVSRASPGSEVVPDNRFYRFSSRLMSTNGRYVGFVTSTPIAATDTNGQPDLYILDRWTGSNIWASAAADGVTPGRGAVAEAILSPNGKTAVFASNSTNLPGVAVLVNGLAPLNLFTFDLETRLVRCLSLSTNGTNWANAACQNPVIDGSGQTVVFETSASSLFPAGVSGQRLVAAFLTNQSRLVLATNQGLAATIVLPSISDDGRFVASFLNPTDQSYGYEGNVLLHDLAARSNMLLRGVTTPGPEGFGGSVTRPFVSKDGRFLVAVTNRAFLVIRDNLSGTVTLTAAPWVSPAPIRGTAIGAPLPVADASFSRDGRFMLVGYLTNNLPAVLDLQTGQVDPMILGSGKPALPLFASARLSPSGRRILFSSAQQELEPGEREWLSRVWVYDRVTKSLELLSPETGTGLRFSGAGAAYWLGDESGVIYSGGSGFQVLSATGDQMIPVVRRVALVVTDTDGDGLDDDWERLNFGSLDKNGTDDEDGDGLSNFAEFIGGSNPKDASSGFRPVTQIASAGSRRLEWPASPGVGYRVEFSASLAPGSWTPLTNIVANLGSIATCTDPNTAGVSNRFYRVIAVP